MGEGTVFTVGAGVVLFLAGLFFKDKFVKRKEIQATVKEAKQAEEGGAVHAKARYDEKVKQAEADARVEIENRPRTGDARADLSDRLGRHAEFIRRRDARKRMRQSD